MVEEGRHPVRVLGPTGLRKRLVLQLVIGLVIFLSGAAAGTGGTLYWLIKVKDVVRFPRSSENSRVDPKDLVESWTTTYGLSPKQAMQIQQVLDEGMQARREFFNGMRENMNAADVVFVGKIQSILNEGQFIRWHEAFQERKQRHRGWEGGRRRRGPPRGPQGRDPNRPRPEEPNDT